MEKFVVTFGSKYAHEPHPLAENVNVNFYYTLFAENENQAREKIFNVVGEFWAFIYKHDDFISNFSDLHYAREKEFSTIKRKK